MFMTDAVIQEKIRLGDKEWRMVFLVPDMAAAAKPGQFVMLGCGNGNDPFLRRAISIHDVEGAALTLDIQVVGSGTALLGALNTGDTVHLLGPLGQGFDTALDGGNVCLVGGGIGKAPFGYLLRALQTSGTQVTAIMGGRNADALGGLDAFENNAQVELRLATEDGSLGTRGFVTDLMDDIRQYDRIYACGPTPMLRAVKTLAEAAEVPCQISLEGKMACGVGVCLGCTCDNSDPDGLYHKVCTDGPVFWSKEVLL